MSNIGDYQLRAARQDDGAFGAFTLEYEDDHGRHRIERLSDLDGFNLCDELDAAGDDWRLVWQKWAAGYRSDRVY